jgi:hypothetical protein
MRPSELLKNWTPAQRAELLAELDKQAPVIMDAEFDAMLELLDFEDPFGNEQQDVPHSLAGFRGAFTSINKRKPTEQEIWDAAIRSWRDLHCKEYIVPKYNLARLVVFAVLAINVGLDNATDGSGPH